MIASRASLSICRESIRRLKYNYMIDLDTIILRRAFRPAIKTSTRLVCRFSNIRAKGWVSNRSSDFAKFLLRHAFRSMLDCSGAGRTWQSEFEIGYISKVTNWWRRMVWPGSNSTEGGDFQPLVYNHFVLPYANTGLRIGLPLVHFFRQSPVSLQVSDCRSYAYMYFYMYTHSKLLCSIDSCYYIQP